MTTEIESRKLTLDHMVDEKFAEIFFLAKEEYDIESKSLEEQLLYDLLDEFKNKLKKKCKEHFGLGDNGKLE
jgi:hypothetical protein